MQPKRRLRGLGTQRSAELEKIGLKTVADLLYYLPRRYLDRSTIVKCRDLREGLKATVVGKIASTRLVQIQIICGVSNVVSCTR